MSRFGTWTSPRHVETSYIDLVNKWLPTYIAEAERQFGLAARTLPVPERGQYTTSRDQFQKWPEDQTPAVIVLAPGLAGDARKEADRSWTAPVGLGFGVIAATPFFEAATELAQILAVAIREIVLHLPPEGIKVDSVELLDEQYGDVENRALGSSRVIFRVWVRNWGSGEGGPINRQDPPDDPYTDPGERPTVTSVFVNLTNARRID